MARPKDYIYASMHETSQGPRSCSCSCTSSRKVQGEVLWTLGSGIWDVCAGAEFRQRYLFITLYWSTKFFPNVFFSCYLSDTVPYYSIPRDTIRYYILLLDPCMIPYRGIAYLEIRYDTTTCLHLHIIYSYSCTPYSCLSYLSFSSATRLSRTMYSCLHV